MHHIRLKKKKIRIRKQTNAKKGQKLFCVVVVVVVVFNTKCTLKRSTDETN